MRPPASHAKLKTCKPALDESRADSTLALALACVAFIMGPTYRSFAHRSLSSVPLYLPTECRGAKRALVQSKPCKLLHNSSGAIPANKILKADAYGSQVQPQNAPVASDGARV